MNTEEDLQALRAATREAHETLHALIDATRSAKREIEDVHRAWTDEQKRTIASLLDPLLAKIAADVRKWHTELLEDAEGRWRDWYHDRTAEATDTLMREITKTRDALAGAVNGVKPRTLL